MNYQHRYTRTHHTMEAEKPFRTALRAAIGWEIGQVLVGLIRLAIVGGLIAAFLYAVNTIK